MDAPKGKTYILCDGHDIRPGDETAKFAAGELRDLMGTEIGSHQNQVAEKRGWRGLFSK